LDVEEVGRGGGGVSDVEEDWWAATAREETGMEVDDADEAMEQAAWRAEVDGEQLPVDDAMAVRAGQLTEDERVWAAWREEESEREEEWRTAQAVAASLQRADEVASAARLVAGSRRAKRSRDHDERAWRREKWDAPSRVTRGPRLPMVSSSGQVQATAVVRSREPLKRGRDVYARDETIH
jgi:hypothetical protein